MSLQNTNICPYSENECAEKKDLCDKFPSKHEAQCVSKTTNSSIVCIENGMRYELKNDNQSCVKKIAIDNCLISDTEVQKCDYAVLICNSEICCFIELKGSDIKHACDQILYTIRQLNDIVMKCQKIYARIIPSRYSAPNIRSRPKELLFRLCKKYNGDLKIQTRRFEDRVSEL